MSKRPSERLLENETEDLDERVSKVAKFDVGVGQEKRSALFYLR